MTNNSSVPFAIHQLPASITFIIIGPIGIFGNLGILACQYKMAAIRNWFIAGLALADLLVTIHTTTWAAIEIHIQPWTLTQDTCARGMVSYLSSIGASTFMTLFVSIDRFIAVKWAMRYDHAHRSKVYLAMPVVLAFFVYPVVISSLAVHYADTESVVPACLPPTAVQGSPAFAFWVGSSFCVNCLVVLVYGMLQVAIYRLRSGDEGVERPPEHQQLSRSISVVVLMYILTWLLTMVILGGVGSIPGIGMSTMFHVSLYVGALAALNNANNGYVYLWLSPTYREALRLVFGLPKATVGSVGLPNGKGRWAEKTLEPKPA